MTDPNTSVRNYARRALDLFASYGDEEALVAPDGRRFTYAEVRAGVVTMASALWANGVRPGTAIGVLARNPPESLFLQLAAHLMGCRTAWIANNAPPRFRAGFLALSQVDVFVYDTQTVPAMGEGLAATAPGVPVLCFGPDGLGPDLAAFPRADELPFDPAEVTFEPSSLFQTGGTTGSPKLVHHHQKFFFALQDLAAAYIASGEPRLRHLLIAGTWHVSAQTAAFMTLFAGGTLFLHDGLEYEPFLRTIEGERINSTLLSPGFFYELLDHPLLAQTDTSSLRTFSVAGSAAAPARLSQAIDKLGPVLRVVYGMSESPFIAALPDLNVDPAHPERLASCGVPYGDIRVEIRDADGKVVEPGQVGEIWIAGSLLMAGYWGMPELTAETIVDGWLRTGDAGKVDEYGYLYVVDRYKDMIVTGLSSTNVFCRPVEDVMAAHPEVRAAAVIGVPHPDMGESIYAYVVTTPGATVTGAELRAMVAAEFNDVWAPREVEFIDEFPYTDSGKVDKRALRDRYLARVR
ncbi:acyl-CoA synthetase (AMP-forming)/AMP-acid ligase II [Allocatelliglobosispora scoriae]|uniref:Acyl-CoA synthetase (AMP-forming)/AMP-acid ligase II n=1 Tax=Allocatelliglobosispora scoriae TaxID=643052 RepID=A0A841BZQ1_9ACTN|nr:AMP-binding protein [Allocatelliglobosispora scoriae]MBB5872579.1 acyl-CoA synthetase (AMP-forming)/AMP-acid ligase II [Allocatelliglobosispora scoriae]